MIIQDLNGTSRAKKVLYLKNNSFLYTSIYNPKLDSLNQLVERYLQHNKEIEGVPPDIELLENTEEGLKNWTLLSVTQDTTAEIFEEDLEITEVLSNYDILGRNGESISVSLDQEQCPFDRVILPTQSETLFTVIKSDTVVHWRG